MVDKVEWMKLHEVCWVHTRIAAFLTLAIKKRMCEAGEGPPGWSVISEPKWKFDTSPKKKPSKALPCTVHRKEIKDTVNVGKLPTKAQWAKNMIQICVQPRCIQNLHFKRKCYSLVTFANFGKVTHAHQKCAYRILNSLVVQWLGLRAATEEVQVWSPVAAQRPYMPCSTAGKGRKCVFRVCEGQSWFWVRHVSHRNYCMQDTGSGCLCVKSLHCKWQWSNVTSGIIWTPKHIVNVEHWSFQV